MLRVMGGSTSFDVPTTIGLPLLMTMSDTVTPVSAAWAAAALSTERPSAPTSTAAATVRLPVFIHTLFKGADTKGGRLPMPWPCPLRDSQDGMR